MARHREDLGERKHVRIDLHQPGFLIPAPDAPWIECTIVDVSENGACLDVGAMPVPKIFGLAFTGGGEVLRVSPGGQDTLTTNSSPSGNPRLDTPSDMAFLPNGDIVITDEKGGKVMVPGDKIAYLELGSLEPRRIGFGNTL